MLEGISKVGHVTSRGLGRFALVVWLMGCSEGEMPSDGSNTFTSGGGTTFAPGSTGSAAGTTGGDTAGTTTGVAGTTTGGDTESTTGAPGTTSSGGTAGTTTGAAGSTSGTTSPMDGSMGSLDGGMTGEAGAATDGGMMEEAGMTDGEGDADAGMQPDPSIKYVGNITTRGQVRDDFASYWNQISPENEGKWVYVERERDQMNWSSLDRIANYARDNGLLFRGHTFVWRDQQPDGSQYGSGGVDWLSRLSSSEQAEEVEEWIRLFCERYPDVHSIDVVNEAAHKTPSYAGALGGAGSSGYDWIVQSFVWADQYCPDAILMLNEYNTIEYEDSHNRFVDIVEKIKAAGAPIDAIGIQAHAAFRFENDHIRGYLDRLAATGLPLYITEYDIDVASDQEQRQIMERQFSLFWNDERIKGITLWGYVQGATWLANSGLMSSDGRPRPAMTWLMDFLEQQRSP